MEKLIFLFLLIVSASASAQIVTKDTVWQENQSGNFYEVRLVEYSNGTYSQNRTLVGDTVTVFNGYLNSFVGQGNSMANDAAGVSQFGKIISGMDDRNTDVRLVTGRDIFDTLTATYALPLLIQGWNITVDTAQIDIAFSVNANGQLRYQVQGFPTRNAIIVSNTMRLANFAATGKTLDIYKRPGGNWFSIDNEVKMKFPGNQGLDKGAVKEVAIASIAEKIKEKVSAGVFLEYYTDATGKVTLYAGENVTIKKSGSKYTVKTSGGKTFEVTEKK